MSAAAIPDDEAPGSRRPLDVRLAAMLRAGRPLRAVFNGLASPALVEMCAYAGFDFTILDNEHGSADLGTTEHMLRAARAAGIPAIVRCFEPDIARVLDLGAAGVQVPMVETAEQAARLATRIRYPLPGGAGGLRGSAFSTRAAGYGAFGGAEHTRRSNEGLVFVAMIETPTGVANAEAIAAVDGVDAVFVGPNDLAHTMGHEHRSGDAPVVAAIERVLRAVSAAGKAAGVLAPTPADEARYAASGATWFASVASAIVTRALREVAQAGR
ncbi:MAG: 2-keto-3-deoxy-L-rhamnonate aldolase [Pseudomonadota bacterium]